jgi:hypothetical protein
LNILQSINQVARAFNLNLKKKTLPAKEADFEPDTVFTHTDCSAESSPSSRLNPFYQASSHRADFVAETIVTK